MEWGGVGVSLVFHYGGKIFSEGCDAKFVKARDTITFKNVLANLHLEKLR
jgi:hypothetical protein